MEKKIFKKEFARDHSLLIQEAWYEGQLQTVAGVKNPYLPLNIYYIEDGACEIWENQVAMEWYKDQLLKENLKDDSFYKKSMEIYDDILKKLSSFWSKEYLSSIAELKEFVKLITRGTQYFLIFYYSAYDERTPQNIRERAQLMRNEDNFYNVSNKLVRNTVAHFYPQLTNLDIGMTLKDFENPPAVVDLKKRKEHCVFIPNQVLEITTIHEWLDRNPEYFFEFDEIKDQNILSGQVAFKGSKVKGTVRVVKREEQIEGFLEGEILVSPMTTPFFVPAIIKAGAIVTDEGGITCHAAILAREMKKPCIIGTKVATQIFKDGDRVEVDANRGIVKKIK